MHPVDLHIIHFNEPKWMLDRCIASLDDQPVNIHVVKGVYGHPPDRTEAFLLGSAEYKSFADPDDTVKPGAFDALLEHAGHDLIWGDEEVILPDGKIFIQKRLPHHAYLIKAGLAWLNYGAGAPELARQIPRGNLSYVHIPRVCYTWNYFLGCVRRHQDGS